MRRRFATNCIAAMLGVVVNSEICRAQDVAKIADDHRDVARSIGQVSCVLAARAARFRIAWDGKSKSVTRVQWQLTVGKRVVSRGNIRPTLVADPTIGDHLAFLLEMPPVRPGVVMDGELNVTLHAGEAQSIPFKQPLFVFADDPFVDREEWLRDLKIRLFDPDGATQKILEKHAIPFDVVTTAAAIDALSDGVLILGEEISWSDNSAAVSAAVQAARRGCRVLCLAPKEGLMLLNSESPDEPTEMSTLFAARETIIHRFDKRFDTREWPGGPSVVSRLGLVFEDGCQFARVTDSQAAWPWLEVRFANAFSSDEGSGTLIICGLGIIKHWNDGPVPRYLFLAVLGPSAIDPFKAIQQ
jgi:hypothetical protein